MILILKSLFWFLTLMVVVGTLLPLIPSDKWWIRGWDFPRMQLAVLAVALLLIALFVPLPERLLALILLPCVAWQGWHVLPYTPLVAKEVPLVTPPADHPPLTLFFANVEMDNPRKAQLQEMIRDADPDILFLMETDQGWTDAMEPLLEGYSTVLRHPTDDYYGLLFATRLDVDAANVVFLSSDDTPAVVARLRDPAGGDFILIGLHPRPPLPGTDTTERDTQIINAARIGEADSIPALVIGDFNEAAWARTMTRFRKLGGFLDPRVGRGPLPSFHAKNVVVRSPIDQLYLTAGVSLASFERGMAFGSDHFPMHARFFVPAGD